MARREKCRWSDADAERWPWPTKNSSGEKVDLRGGMRGYLRGMGANL
ncbi:hypothetical protein QP426_05100 [Pauljensenia sp. UMB1235]|nr:MULTISPECIES: hypothetical protein [unclassified Pauljensenia]MDK6400629.1 hypothetical protein [Pauljensenia sp. UMB9872]MDK7173039.1 hypothetical protein [Pauljensenia sp. UMB1235]